MSTAKSTANAILLLGRLIDDSSIAAGKALVYDGTKHVYQTITTSVSALDDVGDVTITSAASGHYLRFDGSAWVNAAVAQSDVSGLVSDLAAKAPLDSPTFSGSVYIPSLNSAVASTGVLSATSPGGETTPVSVTGAFGQTADLQRWKDVTNAAVASVSPTGGVTASSFTGDGTGLTLNYNDWDDSPTSGTVVGIANLVAQLAHANTGTNTGDQDLSGKADLSGATFSYANDDPASPVVNLVSSASQAVLGFEAGGTVGGINFDNGGGMGINLGPSGNFYVQRLGEANLLTVDSSGNISTGKVTSASGYTFSANAGPDAGVCFYSPAPFETGIASGDNGSGGAVEAIRIDATQNVAVTGNLSAANLSGTNTGDQDLSGYALLSGGNTFAGGATFGGAVSASNLSGTNTGDQDLSGYAQLFAPSFTGGISAGGTITLPYYNQIVFGDENWRIKADDGTGLPFTRSLVTGPALSLVHFANPGQGFAIGVNGGDSDFEILGNHQAFFRGNVGIGTTTAGSALTVNGTVDGTAYKVGGVAGATGTIDLTTATSISVAAGLITAWS